MWIVDIQADGAEEILDTHVVGVHTIDEILIPSTYNDLEGEHRESIHLNNRSRERIKAAVCNFYVSAKVKHDQPTKKKKQKVRAVRLEFYFTHTHT